MIDPHPPSLDEPSGLGPSTPAPFSACNVCTTYVGDALLALATALGPPHAKGPTLQGRRMEHKGLGLRHFRTNFVH